MLSARSNCSLREIRANRLITHVAPLSATAEAFAALESGQEMKV